MNTQERKCKLNEMYEYLLRNGIVTNKKDFASKLQINYNGLVQAMNGSERYLTDSLLSKAAALQSAGRATMQTSPLDIESTSSQDAPARVPDRIDMVPTVPYKIYNEVGVNIIEYVKQNQVPHGPAIAQFAQTDFHMFVSNDEMKPHLRAGDVLSLKKVPENAPIINGEIYVVNSQHLGLTIRFLYDRGEHYELRSSNEWYETFTLPKEQVFSIFRILGLVRTNI